MIFWRDVPVRINHKCWHIHKIGGIFHRDFTKDYGDLPVGRINTVTNRAEAVVNNRGMAYATRNRKKFLNSKKYNRQEAKQYNV
jgi:hypothetical protein